MAFRRPVTEPEIGVMEAPIVSKTMQLIASAHATRFELPGRTEDGK